MLEAGVIRRVRQTLMATNLAQGALVAWQIPEDRLNAAFDYMFQQDHSPAISSFARPIRRRPVRTIAFGPPSESAQGFSLAKHAEFLRQQTGGKFLLMPAKRLFALGVGHVRRRKMVPGSKSEELATVIGTRSCRSRI